MPDNIKWAQKMLASGKLSPDQEAEVRAAMNAEMEGDDIDNPKPEKEVVYYPGNEKELNPFAQDPPSILRRVGNKFGLGKAIDIIEDPEDERVQVENILGSAEPDGDDIDDVIAGVVKEKPKPAYYRAPSVNDTPVKEGVGGTFMPAARGAEQAIGNSDVMNMMFPFMGQGPPSSSNKPSSNTDVSNMMFAFMGQGPPSNINRPLPQTAAAAQKWAEKQEDRTYFHKEPSLERAVAFYERDPNFERRIKKLQDLDRNKDNIKNSKAYNEFADILWKEVHDTFSKTGERAYRLDHLDPEDAMSKFDYYYGKALPSGAAALSSADSLFSLNTAKQFAGALPITQGEQLLIDRGLLPQIADKVSEYEEENPVASGLGAVAPILLEGAGLLKNVPTATKLVMKAAKYAGGGKGVKGKIARGLALGVPAGSFIGGAGEAMNLLGEQARGHDVSLEESRDRIITEGATSGVGEALGVVGGELAGGLAKKGVNWVLDHPQVGPLIKKIRTAGGTGWTSPETYPKYQEMSRKVGDKSRRVAYDISPTDFSRMKAGNTAHKIIYKEIDDSLKAMGKENETWYNKMAGVKADPEPLMESLRELASLKLDKNLTSDDMLKLPKLMKESPFPSVDDKKISELYGRLSQYKKDGVSARQLDLAINEVDSLLSQYAGVPGGKANPFLKLYQKGLREVRDQFGDGSYSEMKHKHHEILKNMGELKFNVGLTAADKLDLASKDQADRIGKALMRDGGPKKLYGKDFEKFRRKYPKLEKQLRDLAGTDAWTQYKSGLIQGTPENRPLSWFWKKAPAIVDPLANKLRNITEGKGAVYGLGIGQAIRPVGTPSERRARYINKLPQKQIDTMMEEIQQEEKR